MHFDRNVAGHCQWKIALFGMIVLALGMGVGRFLYTPMLPVMLHEGIFTFSQLSLIASANYAGYLAGSLFLSLGVFGGLKNSRIMLAGSVLVTVVLIFAMALTKHPDTAIVIRFVAGMANAGMMILGLILVLQHTYNPLVIASLFAGVGVGIVMGNEYVIFGIACALSTKLLWIGASIIATVLFIALLILLPENKHILPILKTAHLSKQTIKWWNLVLMYGLAGFGYIIVATYLPLMAQAMDNQFVARHIWSIVGFAAIPGCFGWLWAAHKWSISYCLCINLFVQASCLVLVSFVNSPILLIINYVGFGATFMGTCALVMLLAKKMDVPQKINLPGLVTFAYSIGQIAGPLMVNMFQHNNNGMTISILAGACALFIAAGIGSIKSINVR